MTQVSSLWWCEKEMAHCSFILTGASMLVSVHKKFREKTQKVWLSLICKKVCYSPVVALVLTDWVAPRNQRWPIAEMGGIELPLVGFKKCSVARWAASLYNLLPQFAQREIWLSLCHVNRVWSRFILGRLGIHELKPPTHKWLINLFILFINFFMYLFLERGEGKEKNRERNINVREKHQSVAPTGDRTCNPGMCT